MNPLTAALEPLFAQLQPRLVEIYQDLHQHPELSMQEQRTAGITAYRKFKRPFRAVCWVGGGRASPVLGTDRTSVSGISASRGHAAALSAAMLR